MDERPLYPFQARALDAIFRLWSKGTRRVLLVAPTGAGKTRMGVEPPRRALRHGHRVLWLCHRRELLKQAHDTLWQELDIEPAVLSAGRLTTDAPLVVATVQSLAQQAVLPPARLVVFDEAHHFVADEWGRVAQAYAKSAILGLTATPERSDGRPLSPLFDEIVTAATYPQLIAGNYLVPALCFSPDEAMKRALAQNPVKAYQEYGEGGQAIVFAPSVELAHRWAQDFREAGHEATCIEQGTATAHREMAVENFRRGTLRVLTNVYVLTEGFDAPAASCVILGREIGHVTPYLQMCGRGMRSSPGKSHCVIIDLAGNTLRFGLPSDEREYSLGDGIVRTKGQPALRVCQACGYTFDGVAKCPRCGFQPEVRKPARPTIYDMALREVYAGQDTEHAAKKRELERLLSERVSRGWDYRMVTREYEKLFHEKPKPWDVPLEVRQWEWAQLVAERTKKGYAMGWAAHRYHALFGHWPPKEWQHGN